MTDAQFAQLMAVLIEIRDVFKPPEEPPTTGCPHPEELRVSLATSQDPLHWVCSLCKEHFDVVTV